MLRRARTWGTDEAAITTSEAQTAASTPADLIWAAGLFEGEGAAMLEKSGRPRLSLKMVEETSVRRFAAAVGGGKVYGPYENNTGRRDGYKRRPFWLWVATGPAAFAVSEALRPYLSPWRISAIEAWYSSRGNTAGG